MPYLIMYLTMLHQIECFTNRIGNTDCQSMVKVELGSQVHKTSLALTNLSRADQIPVSL